MPNQTNLGLVRIAHETVQERVYVALRDRLIVERALETLPSRTVRVPALSRAALCT